MKSNKPLRRQLTAQFFYKNKAAFAVALFSALVSGLLNLLLSWIMQQLIDAISGTPGTYPLGTLTWISVGLIVLCVAVYLMDYVSLPRFITRAMRQYKDFAFRKLTEKNISSFRDESTASYLSALTNDATAIESDYISQLLTTATMLTMFVGSVVMMLVYSPLLTAIAMGLTVLPLIASLLTGTRMTAAQKRVSDKNTDFTASLKDCLSGFSVVKSFTAEKEIFKLFAESNAALEGEKYTRQRIKTLVGMIGSVTGATAQVGVFVAGAYLALSGHAVSAGTVIVFVNLMNFIIQPVSQLPTLLAGRKAALGLIGKLADALDKSSASDEGKSAAQLGDGLRVDDVCFSYEEGREVLHHVSADFAAGKSYAIVGGSGSGKSTLLNLLMGSGGAYTGNIFVGQDELRGVSGESLYELMSVIQQNVFVFNASIRDNITMFRDFPKNEVDEAIRRAHLSELIERHGNDYLCGENGKGLSGGEKQRVSIARSLLKKSSVLLVDEATAALDAQTAHQVASDLLSLSGVTRIVVTHSLEDAILKRYDNILAMKDGRIVEQGTFEELLAKKGYFYALYTVAQ